MLKTFIAPDFLLKSLFAKRLYHGYAAEMPIIDYHCHLQPDLIAKNHQFSNLTEIWLKGDHYKWRAMRTYGIDEECITGNASNADKFAAWAETTPHTVRNPLYHWTHMELHNPFGITELLSPETGISIYANATEQLQQPHLSTQGLLKQFKVTTVCTTDDPVDSLEHHKQIALQANGTQVRPTFRPDKVFNINNGDIFIAYIAQLGSAANTQVTDLNSLLNALTNRIQYFHDNGCRLSDFGHEKIYDGEPINEIADKTFKKAISGQAIPYAEAETYRITVLHFLATEYHRLGWAMQYHLGAIRNNNARLLTTLGADSGFDSIGDYPMATSMVAFFNRLDSTNQLAKTILYNLNPRDNALFATMAGNYNDGSVKGKIQFGSAWWFLDQKHGMEEQINALSNFGLLSCFIGMLTDSRSFLSYSRHEYFRRILCNLIGQDVEDGLLPPDEALLGTIVHGICYNNAKAYFNFA